VGDCFGGKTVVVAADSGERDCGEEVGIAESLDGERVEGRREKMDDRF
jgi:hypothetical protein